MIAETRLDVSDLVLTTIVSDAGPDRVDIPSLPGVPVSYTHLTLPTTPYV